MLRFLQSTGKASERKLRLFGVACCRAIWRLLPDEDTRKAVLVAERYADGLATAEEAKAARWDAVTTVLALERGTPAWHAANTAFLAGDVGHVEGAAAEAARAAGDRAAEMGAALGYLLRDLIGPLPFRPATADPSWLTWNDATVPKIAARVFEERDSSLMPILADALEDAGCSSSEMLEHLRWPGPHVRGCWVIDLLLGKE